MPVPIVAVLSALASGGTLVPHSAGGLIISSGGSYVAGTYLSTTAVSAILGTATASVGAGAAAVTGAVSAVIGSGGIFGTTFGATGITGALMSVGIIPATPIAVPVVIGATCLGGSYVTFFVIKLIRKVRAAENGEEVIFTEREAKIIEALIRWIAKRRKK